MLFPRTAAPFVLLLLLGAPTAVAAKESREAKLKKPRIAVLSFPAASGAWGCGGWGNSEGRMANVLRDLFTTAIMEEADGKVRVVERERLDEIRGELKFQQSGEVDGATAQQIGKLLGVRYMLTGKMTRFACKKTGANTGWGVGALVGKVTGSGLAGSVAGSVDTHKVKFTGRLDVRLIDTQSGEVLGTFKDEEDTSDTSVKIAGGGMDVDYDDELANKVFEPVVERLTPKILKKIAAVHEENLAENAEEADEEVAAADARNSRRKTDADDDDAGEDEEAAPPARIPAGKEKAGAGAKPVPAKLEVYGNDFDFVPGEKVLFFDDFTDTDVGDSPMKWRGGGMAVVESGGKRWLQDTGTRMNVSDCNAQQLRLDVKGDFPKKFTIEFDAVLGKSHYGLWFKNRNNLGVSMNPFVGKVTHVNLKHDRKSLELPTGVQHVAISVNETYAKLYVGGRRVAQDTDALERPFTVMGICLLNRGAPPLVTNFKIAEGGKDYATELTTLGRIVTQAITFELASALLRPESGPMLRKILKLLQDDASLRFEIEGHTDAQGGEKVNRPLSEKRAAAVKAWLVEQGVEDDRLTTEGLGATKPLDSNDTAEGRANNRRVEFVKMSST